MSKKILIIAPNWIGDMVGAQSLLISLKILNPDCVIDVAGPKACLELTKFMPEVNETFILDLKHGKVGFKKRWLEAKQIKAKNYDQCIITPNSIKSAIIPFLARIKKRTGWLGESRYILLNDHRKLDKQTFPLMVDRYNALAFDKSIIPNSAPLPRMSVSKQQITETTTKYSIDTTIPTIAICPGAAYGPSKQWPAKYFASVSKSLIAKGYNIIVLGSPADNEISQERVDLTNSKNIINLSGKTSIAEVAILLVVSKLVVSNDSGLGNISCALGLESVILYGSSAGAIVAPPKSDNLTRVYVPKLECHPCKDRVCHLGHFKCMMDLTPEKVLTIIKSKIQEADRSTSKQYSE